MALEIGANRFSIKFCVRKSNLFFSKIEPWYQKKHPNLKILESAGPKIFSQEVYQDLCRWNRICQIFILTLWFVTPPYFLPKITQEIEQKLIIFFPERGEEIEPFQQRSADLEDVLKTSWRHVLKKSSTRLQRNNFSSSKTSSRRLEDVYRTCLEDAFKTSWRQTKCLLGRSVSNKSKCVSNKSIFNKSISDESKANPKCNN